jgi:hypothetical protein
MESCTDDHDSKYYVGGFLISLAIPQVSSLILFFVWLASLLIF